MCSLCSQRPEAIEHEISGAEGTGGCEPPDVDAGNWTQDFCISKKHFSHSHCSDFKVCVSPKFMSNLNPNHSDIGRFDV